eukprot:1478806-Rhodomonas_salina.1
MAATRNMRCKRNEGKPGGRGGGRRWRRGSCIQTACSAGTDTRAAARHSRSVLRVSTLTQARTPHSARRVVGA